MTHANRLTAYRALMWDTLCARRLALLRLVRVTPMHPAAAATIHHWTHDLEAAIEAYDVAAFEAVEARIYAKARDEYERDELWR